MKKILLFTALLASSIGFSQTNLILNGTCDDFQEETGDNADAWDMSPNSKVKLDGGEGAETDSPYAAIWKNSTLEDYLETTYNGGDNIDEQPGSSSSGTYDGATETRSVKLYDDGNPVIAAGVSTRRLYQKVEGLTIGASYTFTVESRSNQDNVSTEIFILNEEIVTEVGLDDPDTDTRVDEFFEILGDFASSPSEGDNTFKTSTFTFTASKDFVVVYFRALNAFGTYLNSDNEEKAIEVYYDNFSLVESATASVKDVLASKFDLFPNPAKETLRIQASDVELTSVQVYSVLGKEVYASKTVMSSIDVSNFAKGMYLLKLNTASGSATKKIIVE